ncbi:hypothetical protein BLNAU_17628 [Blattamonas nauphoetae]|uniref:Cpl-7 lysozyme C-terminal domain-containing protein n=1 Tax=Blattamonas nauphoetae TaxID=2049346 RepID=A0ABQ9X6M4_9EUKA|nr:hypothetical protein BLNAU_17628 [Blattamonas nauphoetae]
MAQPPMTSKARPFDKIPDEELLLVYNLPKGLYSKKAIVAALRQYFGPIPDGKIIPYEWAEQDPNLNTCHPTEIMLKMKDPTLIDRICENPIHEIEIGGSPSTDVPPTKHLIGVSKVNRSRSLIVTPKFPNQPKHSNKREHVYLAHGAHAEFIGDARLSISIPSSYFVVFPTRSAALSALPELQKHNTAVFCDQTDCHSWFKIIGTLSNPSPPPSPDRIDVLNDIAQNIRSFFISKMHATLVLFDLSETSPLSSFEVHFPETESGEQQAKAVVDRSSVTFSTSPSASPHDDQIIMTYTFRSVVPRPDPAKQPPPSTQLLRNLPPPLFIPHPTLNISTPPTAIPNPPNSGLLEDDDVSETIDGEQHSQLSDLTPLEYFRRSGFPSSLHPRFISKISLPLRTDSEELEESDDLILSSNDTVPSKHLCPHSTLSMSTQSRSIPNPQPLVHTCHDVTLIPQHPHTPPTKQHDRLKTSQGITQPPPDPSSIHSSDQCNSSGQDFTSSHPSHSSAFPPPPPFIPSTREDSWNGDTPLIGESSKTNHPPIPTSSFPSSSIPGSPPLISPYRYLTEQETWMVAFRVVDGQFGKGADKELNLEQAGYDPVMIMGYVRKYKEVESRKLADPQRQKMNEIRRNDPRRRTDEEIAKEVREGVWGNQPDRERWLTEKGYNYKKIQAIVNSTPNIVTFKPVSDQSTDHLNPMATAFVPSFSFDTARRDAPPTIVGKQDFDFLITELGKTNRELVPNRVDEDQTQTKSQNATTSSMVVGKPLKPLSNDTKIERPTIDTNREHNIADEPVPNQTHEKTKTPSDLLLRLAERSDNLNVAATAWKWIACLTKLVKMKLLRRKVVGVMEPNKQMTDLILRTLEEMCSRLRKDLKEGQIAVCDSLTSSLLQSCLSVLLDQLNWTALDPAPFLPVLSSLTLTTDIHLLSSLHSVFVEISHKTTNSQNPFSISTFTIPFTPDPNTPTQPTTFLSIIASSVLSFTLAQQQKQSSVFQNRRTLFGASESEELEVIVRSLRSESPETWPQFCVCMVDAACDLLAADNQSADLHTPSRRLVFHQSLGQSVEATYPNFIWRSILVVLEMAHERLSFTALLPIVPSLTRLAAITLTLLPDWMESQFYDSPRWTKPFSPFHRVFCLSTSSTIHTHPSISPLLRTFAILFTRDDTILHDGLTDIIDLQTSTARRLSKANLSPAILMFLEEGAEDQCERGRDHTMWAFNGALGMNSTSQLPITESIFGIDYFDYVRRPLYESDLDDISLPSPAFAHTPTSSFFESLSKLVYAEEQDVAGEGKYSTFQFCRANSEARDDMEEQDWTKHRTKPEGWIDELPPGRKTSEEIAEKLLQGLSENHSDRKRRFTENGYDFGELTDRINADIPSEM